MHRSYSFPQLHFQKMIKFHFLSLPYIVFNFWGFDYFVYIWNKRTSGIIIIIITIITIITAAVTSFPWCGVFACVPFELLKKMTQISSTAGPPPPCESHASDLSDGISNPHTIHQFYPVLFGSCDIHVDLAKALPHLGIGSNDFFTHFKSL